MEKPNIIYPKKVIKTAKERSTQLQFLGFQITQKINLMCFELDSFWSE